MSEYHWKDMEKCSGAVPKLSPRFFEVCYNPVSKGSPKLLPLCAQHIEDIFSEVLKPSLRKIEYLEEISGESYGKGLEDGLSHRAKESEEMRKERERARWARSVVYFLRCGNFVKIGTSTSIDTRVSSIRKSGGVLMPDGLDFKTATLVKKVQGSTNEEKALHARFDHLRHTGEWFTEAPDLTAYIDSLQDYEIPVYEPKWRPARRQSDVRKEAVQVALEKLASRA